MWIRDFGSNCIQLVEFLGTKIKGHILSDSQRLINAILKRSAQKPVSANRKLDMYKLVFDLMKHITTLSSGSILIFIALLEKVFKSKPPQEILFVTFGLFSIAIVTAIMAMMVLAFNATEGKMDDSDKNWFVYSATGASVAFTMGILFLAIYAIILS